MTVSLPDARELSDEVLEALRRRALRGCELGFTEADVANLLGVCRETVCHRWSADARGGWDALPGERTGRPVGSGRALSDDQAGHIQQPLRAHRPEELGIAAPLWTRRAVAALIRQEFAISLAVRTVGLYLERWGFTAQRPRRHARDPDPFEVRQGLEETSPSLAAGAEKEGAEIHRGDEVGVAAAEHRACGDAPKGERATRDVPDPPVRANQIATIRNEGKVHFMSFPGTMNAARLLVFLGRRVRTTTRKMVLIVDRLRAPMTPEVAAWLMAHRDRIEVFSLPTDAPELNADADWNNDLKGTVNAAGLPHNKGEVRSRIQEFLRRLLHLPDHVMRYFQHPSVQYAAAMNV